MIANYVRKTFIVQDTRLRFCAVILKKSQKLLKLFLKLPVTFVQEIVTIFVSF
jgi:hypothetical protein